MKYLLGIFAGILLSFAGLFYYSKNTYVAMNCDLDKYSFMYESLYETVVEDLYGSYGLHCLRGTTFVKAPGLGQLSQDTINSLTDEYGYVPEGLKGFK